MGKKVTEVEITEIPLEDRLLSLENQGYMTYLMTNSLIKVLDEKGIINKDDLAKEMDELNERLFALTKEMIDNDVKDKAAGTETVPEV